jgi:hypothetical protein
MKESLRRKTARRDFNESCESRGKISIMNSYGTPIGKPICIRSLRRANRIWLKIWQGHIGADTPATGYKKNSARAISRSVRLLERQINRKKWVR